MYILHITPELAPIAKMGGLADVTYGLCKEQIRQGHHVQVFLPKYDTIHYNLLQDMSVYYRDLWSYDGPNCYHNTIWSAELETIPLLLLEPHHPGYLFNRGTIYGCTDDIERFIYFSRACVEFLFKSGLRPDILHLHDWPSALIPLLQKDMYQSLGWKPIKTILTIHNLEHQGKCHGHELTRAGLQAKLYLNSLQDPLHPPLVNLLKGGILYADAIVTVSPSYKKEILSEEHGFGLHTILEQYSDKLYGILNGIDEDFWNPEIDPYLPYPFPAHPPFTRDSWSLILQNKAKNKSTLRKELGLVEAHIPLIACIGRLVSQKGPYLIAHAFKHILSQGAQCVILGSTFSQELHSFFHLLQSEYSANRQGSIILDYNEALAHKLYAAADILMIPSLFEPCGLTQLIALRYGCVPVVRKTGGLADTISEKNGFFFEDPTKEEFLSVLDKAIGLWRDSPQTWHSYLETGMTQDFSWKKATKEYVTIYKKIS